MDSAGIGTTSGEPYAAGVDELMFNEGYRDGDAAGRRAPGGRVPRHHHAHPGLSRDSVARHARPRSPAGPPRHRRLRSTTPCTAALSSAARRAGRHRDAARRAARSRTAPTSTDWRMRSARGVSRFARSPCSSPMTDELFPGRADCRRHAARANRSAADGAPRHAVHHVLPAAPRHSSRAAQALAESDRRDPAQDAGAGEDRRRVRRQRPARGRITAHGVGDPAGPIRDS